MKILYCSYSHIPSPFANSIAVMKQCGALSQLCELRAILVKGNDEKKKNVFSTYGVERFPLLLLPKRLLLFREFGLKMFVLLYALIYKPDVVYSRDLLLNEWLCHFHIKNIYEIHQLAQENMDFDLLYKRLLLRVRDQEEMQIIVCISESLARECMDFGIPKEKLVVMHSGVDLREGDNTEEVDQLDFPPPLHLKSVRLPALPYCHQSAGCCAKQSYLSSKHLRVKHD